MTKKIIFCIGVLSLVSALTYAQDDFPFVGEINSNKVNLRAGQSTNFERLAQLNKGDEVVVVSKNYGWYEIKLPDHVACYVSIKFIQPSSEGYGETTGNRVNVRAEAKETSSVIGQLSKGVKVKIVGQTQDWYQIEPIEGLRGWVSEEFIVFKSKAVPPPKVVVEPSRNIYAREEIPSVPPETIKEPELFSVVGRVEDLGRVVRSKLTRYKLITPDNNKIFYLEDPKNLVGPFAYRSVKAEGNLKEKPEGFLSEDVLIVEKVTPVP